MEPENFDILLCVAGVLMRLERWSGWFCIIYSLNGIYVWETMNIENTHPTFKMKTVKIQLKTWVRLFWTIQKIIQRDSNEENVFSFLDDIMKSGIYINMKSSLRVVLNQAIFKAMSERVGSDIEQLWKRMMNFPKFIEDDVIQKQGRSMSDPTFSDIDFNNEMTVRWTTLLTNENDENSINSKDENSLSCKSMNPK